MLIKKNNYQPPQSFQSLPGSLWGITSYYNPGQYKNRLKNYRRFRENNQKQGLKLICVELVFGDNEFELNSNDADILIQKRSDSVLWQKERLLNIGLEYLPDDCDKVVWLDADIVFCDNNWLEKLSQALEFYIVVQPFSFVVRLSRGNLIKNEKDLIISHKDGDKFYGLAYGVSHLGRQILSNHMEHGLSGFVWAARRSFLDSVGFYDKLILGGGDLLMAHGFFGHKKYYEHNFFSSAMIADKNKWMDRAYLKAGGSVGHLDGIIHHFWHGERKNRFFNYRRQMWKKYNFNPATDIAIDKIGCWRWMNNKKRFHWWLKMYFWLRNEQGSKWRDLATCLLSMKNKPADRLSFLRGIGFYKKMLDKGSVIRMNGWTEKKIKQLAYGLTFADVGGLWGVVKERVSTAYEAGAKLTAMIDMSPKKSNLWQQFNDRCGKLGIKCHKKIIANVDDNNFIKKVGQYDMVSCSGVLYHCPNPEYTISQLAKITKEYLILGTTVIPSKIKNQKGILEIEKGGFLKSSDLSERQRQVINQYFLEVGVKEAVKKDSQWSLTAPDYSLWWYFFTKEYVVDLIKKSGLKIIDGASQWHGRSEYFLIKKNTGKIRTLKYSEFKEMEKKHPTQYYHGRWDYIKKVIAIIRKQNINSVLEIGPLKKTIVKGSDVLDIKGFNENVTFPHDATKIPWPIENKKYDLLIALQVWEHLKDKQAEAFKEVIRVARSAILSFPLNWNVRGDCHHLINREKIRQWTCNVAPTKIIKIKKRIVYFFKFDEQTDITFSRSAGIHQVNGDVVNVVCAGDKRFAQPLMVMIKSVIANLNAKHGLNIFILDGGLDDRVKDGIIALAEEDRIIVNFIDIDSKVFRGLRVDAHVSSAVYYRLLISSVLPPSVKKVIYLDSDLVVNRDISGLWKVNMDDNHILAVSCRLACSAFDNYQELGFKAGDEYFNSGVMVINMEKWKKDMIGKKALHYIKTCRPKWWDQDGLNVVLRNKWRQLDPRWNVIAPLYMVWHDKLDPRCQDRYLSAFADYPIKDLNERKKIVADPYIMHFTTSIKPWIKNYFPPNKHLYVRYKKMLEKEKNKKFIWRYL